MPSAPILNWRSLVPLGAGSLGVTSVRPPPTTTSMLPPLERIKSVLPAGTDSGPLSGEAASLFAAERMTGGFEV